MYGALETNFNHVLHYLQNIPPYIIIECKNALCFLEKKNLKKFKTPSNNKYKQLNLEYLIYCINYTLLENNNIILRSV